MPALRIVTPGPVLRSGPEAPPARAGGMWLTAENRDRKGLVGAQYGSTLSRIVPAGMQRQARLLTHDQRWRLYTTTPDVRACVDSIARRVSTWDWEIAPTLDPKDPGFEDVRKVCEEETRWLRAPNRDGETWQELVSKAATDLLVDDAWAWELVPDRRGKLVEIVALQGATVYPVADTHGRVTRYVQDPIGLGVYDPAIGNLEREATSSTSATTVSFDPSDLLYFALYPNTRGPLGTPLLETLVNETVAVLLASDHLVTAMDADEIPPGILSISGGLTDEAFRLARADFQNMRGKDHKIRIISPSDPDAKVQWIELRHTMKDLALADVIYEVRKTIWRVFGVQPVEMGATQDIPRAVGEVSVDISKSQLLEPILEKVEARVTARVLARRLPPALVGKAVFRFIRDARDTAEEYRARIEGDAKLLSRGALTVNEVRTARGMLPFGKEGDVPLLDTPGGPMPLAAVALSPEPKPEAKPPPGGGEPEPEEPEDEPPPGGNGGGGDGKSGVEDTAATAGEGEAAPGESARARRPAARAEAETVKACWLVPLPEEASDDYAAARASAVRILGEALDDPGLPHVTVLYMGEVSAADLPEIAESAADALDEEPAVAVDGQGIGWFEPTNRSEGRTPILVDYGEGGALEALNVRLLRALAPFVSKAQFPEFHGHATLGYLGRALTEGEGTALRACADGHARWTAREVRLMVGADEIGTIPLGGSAEERRRAAHQLARALRPPVAPRAVDAWRTRLDAALRAGDPHGPRCRHYGCHPTPSERRGRMPAAEDLPSDWQPAGRFAGYRTLDLVALAGDVAGYRDAVLTLYADCAAEIEAAIGAAHRVDGTSLDEADRARTRCYRAIDALGARWALATPEFYRGATTNAAARVEDWTGHAADPKALQDRADRYHAAAMRYLGDAKGLLSGLRTVVDAVLAKITAPVALAEEGPSRDALTKALQQVLAEAADAEVGSTSAVGRIRELTPASSTDEVLRATAGGIEAQAHRIDNWSGKLVELAHEALRDILREQAQAELMMPDRDPEAVTPRWYAEWVAVGDTNTCPVCLDQGSRGIRPIEEFTFVPGSVETDCGALDRCVLVAHTAAEVANGTAISLSGANPRNEAL